MAYVNIVELGNDTWADAVDLWAMHQPPGLDSAWRHELGEFSVYCSTHQPVEIEERVMAEFGSGAQSLGCIARRDGVPIGIARAGTGLLRGAEQQYGLPESTLGFSWAILPDARRQGIGSQLAEAIVTMTVRAISSRTTPQFNRSVFAIVDMGDTVNQKIAEGAGLKSLPVHSRRIAAAGSNYRIDTQLWALPAGR